MNTDQAKEAKGLVVFLDCGGPEFDIQVTGKVYHFEWHPYSGPIALTKKGDPAASQPKTFLFAASQWNKLGREIENGLCVWYHEPEPILEHICGRHYRHKGYKPAVKGE